MKLFPTNLKNLRLHHKMSQEELGKHIHVSKVSISGYERGNRTPDVDTLISIADVFNVSLDSLCGRKINHSTHESTPTDPETDRALEIYSYLKDKLK